MTADIDTVQLGGYPTAIISRRDLAEKMVEDCKGRSPDDPPVLVFSSNGQGIAEARWNDAFRSDMYQADVVHADGQVVVFASKLFGRPLPERVATTDFFHDAAQAACQADLSFYMLGATEAQNEVAVAEVKRRYPGIRIVGRRHGYFDPSENTEVCAEIRASGADVLWLALGKPRQEAWAVANREALVGVGWVKTCGGLFGFLSGDSPRAPLWMQRAGLEWLYRLIREPRRLLLRYLVTNPVAIWMLLTRSGDRSQHEQE